MEKKNRKIISIAVGVAGLAVLAAALWNDLVTREYTVESDKVTQSVRLALVADLHSVQFGENQRDLMAKIRGQKPDAVLFAGDIVDNHVPRAGAEQLFAQLGAEFPCYYVSGNHEFWTEDIDAVKDFIRQSGVTVLEGNSEVLEVRGQRIRICGVDDPECFAKEAPGGLPEGWTAQLASCAEQMEDGVFTLLISHRPELVDAYRDSGFDLVLAGHAHGGLIRLPGLVEGGLFAANQGVFPRYTGGRYELGETPMIVSRGLSLARWPRVFNPPELVIIDVNPAK